MSTTLAPSTHAAPRARRPRNARLQHATAVLVPLVANAVVVTAVDQALHVLGVYPPWGVPMTDVGDNLLALAYRTAVGVLGGYLAARLARQDVAGAPMRAAVTYGVIGFVLSVVGGIVAITQYHTGPAWYPILLAAVALPCAWLGGALHRRGGRGSSR